jgi:hypothetical protein
MCMEFPRRVRFDLCGHAVLCSNCRRQLVGRGRGFNDVRVATFGFVCAYLAYPATFGFVCKYLAYPAGGSQPVVGAATAVATHARDRQ